MALDAAVKNQIMKEHATVEGDTGSPEVQVAVLTKRFSAGHSFQLSYHLSEADGVSFVNDFTGFGVFASPSHPQDPTVDNGPSDFDMR